MKKQEPFLKVYKKSRKKTKSELKKMAMNISGMKDRTFHRWLNGNKELPFIVEEKINEYAKTFDH